MEPIARKLAASITAIATAVLLAQPAWASPPTTGTGTFVFLGVSVGPTRTADGNTFIHLTVTIGLQGTVEGTRVDDATVIAHPNGLFESYGTGTCTCTVAGRSGTWTERFEVRGVFNESSSGRFTVISGTGDLSTLHAVMTIPTGPLGAGTYSIDYHFDP
jgi:hypothetical protein